jgi:hypothetical protein
VTAHLPGLVIEIFTVGHRLDGEQISINVRAVFSRDSQPVLRPRKIAPRAIRHALECVSGRPPILRCGWLAST